jgi:hypothetical protein
LKISSEAFFDLSPVEFYYAIKGIGNQREVEYKEALIIARVNAWLSGLAQRVKELPKSPEDLIKFAWEGEQKQSPEDMKNYLLSFASAHNRRLEKQKALRETPPVKMTRIKK